MCEALQKKSSLRIQPCLYQRTRVSIRSSDRRILFFLFFFLLFTLFHGSAATITSNNVTGNWNATGTWVGGVVPGAGDDVIINTSATITVTANASCASISWTGAPSATRTFTINAGIILTVSGDITLTNTTTTNGRNRVINVLGTLSCNSFSMASTSNDARDIVLSIGTAGTVNMSGDLVMAGTFARNHVDMTGNAVLNIGGNIGATATPTAVGGGFTAPPTTSTINLNGSSIQTVFLFGGASALGILKVNNAAGVTNASTVTVSTLTIGDLTTGSVFEDSGFQVTSTGTLNLKNSSFFKLGRPTATTTFPAFATRTIDAGTTVEYMAGVTQVVSNTPSYSNLTLSGVSKTMSTGTLTIGGELIINSGATFNGGTNNPAVNLSGDFTNGGTYTSGTGLFTMNGTADQLITSSNTLTFSGGLTIANSGSAKVTNSNAAIAIPTGDIMTINSGSIFYAGTNVINGAGTFTLASGGTLGIGSSAGISSSGATGNVQTTTRNFNTGAGYIYNGFVNQAVGNGLPATVSSLTVANTGAGGNNTVTLGANVSVSTDLSITNGIFFLSTFTANRVSGGGTLTVSDGAQLTIGGTGTLPSNYNTHSIGTASTIEYGGTTTTVAALNSSQSYGDLTISGTGVTTNNNFSVSGTLNVTGSMVAGGGTVTMNNAASTITNSGTLTFSGLTISVTPTTQYNTNFTVSGTLTVSGSTNFSPAGGTVTMSGASGIISNTSGTLNFSNLTINGTTVSSTGNFGVGATMQVDGSFAPAATSVISGAGTLNGSGTVQVTRIAATPSFGGQYTIATKSLSGLVVNYNGAGAQTISAENYGSLTISTNGTRTVTLVNGGIIGVSNIFAPTATTTTYVVTNNTFDYNGGGAQTIAAFTYHFLRISNGGAKSILTGTTVSCQTIDISDGPTVNVTGTAVLNVLQ